MTQKAIFKFRLPDNSVGTAANLYDEGVDTELRKRQEIAHYKLMGMYEQEWRNKEYVATDYMLLPRARYKGTYLEGSDLLDDIYAYRDKLYDYKYDTSEPRPDRPDWFKGEL